MVSHSNNVKQELKNDIGKVRVNTFEGYSNAANNKNHKDSNP